MKGFFFACGLWNNNNPREENDTIITHNVAAFSDFDGHFTAFIYARYEHQASGELKGPKQSATQKIFFDVVDECEPQPNFF